MMENNNQEFVVSYSDFALAQRSIWAIEHCEQEITTQLLLSMHDHNLILHSKQAYITPHKAGPFSPSKFKKYIVNYDSFFMFFEKILSNQIIVLKNYDKDKNITILKKNNKFDLKFDSVSLRNSNFKKLIQIFQKKKKNKHVLLHIGYPKCASKFLQKQVFPNLNNAFFLKWEELIFHGFLQRYSYSVPSRKKITLLNECFELMINSVSEENIVISDESLLNPFNYGVNLFHTINFIKVLSSYSNLSILIMYRDSYKLAKSIFKELYLDDLSSPNASNFFRVDKSNYQIDNYMRSHHNFFDIDFLNVKNIAELINYESCKNIITLKLDNINKIVDILRSYNFHHGKLSINFKNKDHTSLKDNYFYETIKKTMDKKFHQDIVFNELNLIKIIFKKLPFIYRNYMKRRGNE